MPMTWNELFNMLNGHENLDLPLILNGWEMSSPLEKNMRFEDHIRWADKNNQIDKIGEYLRSLPEDNWAHYGEI